MSQSGLNNIHCFGYEDAKMQSCNNACPTMKLTGREDEVMMQLVSDLWTTELSFLKTDACMCWMCLAVETCWCISTIAPLVIAMPFALFQRTKAANAHSPAFGVKRKTQKARTGHATSVVATAVLTIQWDPP
jgi:hypothetical protein